LQLLLGLKERDVGHIRYQLLHRAASALLEAQRFHATAAVLIVQSFNRRADEESWRDFGRFGELLGLRISEGSLAASSTPTIVPLYIGWVTSPPATDAALAALV
jgi:hypothetical protein